MQKLTQNTSIFSSITNGAKESVLGFVTSLVTGKLIIDGIKMIFRETIKTITELDAAFNEIAMVTTYTTKEVWKMKDAFVGIAQTTGSTVAQVTELAAAFFRQGRSYSEVLQLTEAAGVAAKIAGISAGDSVNYLTAAINGYQLSANQAMAVSDKFAALAASSATDYEELATALSKVAAQAYSAGVNMDNMMGFIAKAIVRCTPKFTQ
jgi:TP901 family phage tail tape measure protein